MTKMIDDMREEWQEKVKGFEYHSRLWNEIADYWLSVIEQRDRELRENIEKMKKKVVHYGIMGDSSILISAAELKNFQNTESIGAEHNKAIDSVLSLLSPHNKE